MYDKKYKNWWLYILKLENNKWYVGITSKTPEERFAEHLAGRRGAYWTMKHKPLEIELIEDLGAVSREHAEKYENKITRLLMKERGLNNVRGGDLRDVDDYVKRFGWYWIKDAWDIVAYILLLNLIILGFVLDKYNWSVSVFTFIVLTIIIAVLILRKFDK